MLSRTSITTSKCIFSVVSVLLFVGIIASWAEIYAIKLTLKRTMQEIGVEMKKEIQNDINLQVRDELNIVRDDFNSELKEVQSTIDGELTDVRNEIKNVEGDMEQMKIDNEEENALLKNITSEIGSELDMTISNLNDTVKEATKTVHQQVFNLTKDVGSYVNTTESHFNSEDTTMKVQSAGTFALFACIISIYHMLSHIRNFSEPIVQRKILAILWLCPIFSLASWLSLAMKYDEIFGMIKDFYEAYSIYIFLSFIIAVLGRGDRATVVDVLSRHSNKLSISPISFPGVFGSNANSNDKEKADSFLLRCQIAAMQFVFIRPISSIFMVISNHVFDHNISIWDAKYPQFYINVVVNISIFLAFSALVKIYHAVQEELRWCQPLPKFLCIKGVVFMTFWQGLAISITAHATIDDEHAAKAWTQETQSLLICLEMFFFSVVHVFVFPVEEWKEGYQPAEKIRRQFGDNIALRDFVQDVKLILKSRKQGKNEKAEATENPLMDTGEVDGTLYDDDDMVFISTVLEEAKTLKLEEEVSEIV